MPPRFQRLTARQLARPSGLLAGKTMDLLDRSNAARTATCVEASGAGPGKTAVDVGCGGGVGLREMLAAVGPDPGPGGKAGRVHGVELSTAALRRARRRHRPEIAAGRLAVHGGTLQELPLPNASIDALISVNTVYFVPDLAPVRDELARVAAPGARLVLGIADRDRMREIGMPLHGFTLRPVDDVVDTMTAGGALQVTERRRLDDIVSFTVLVLTPRR